MQRYKRQFEESNLRAIEVTFSDNSKLSTDMAANLTDQEMKDYYKIGRVFNIGQGEKDKLVKVKSVKILK
jgi:hypothetical protein